MTVKAKICGLTTMPTLEVALNEGADYVGFVFFPKSPRNLDLKTAASLADAARGRAMIVALLVDPDDATLSSVVEAVDPDIIQLHGHETPDRVAELAKLTGCPIMKAIAVAAETDALRALDYDLAADLILFDAKPPPAADLPGGNGVTFDWSLLASVKDRVPYMLSGGLTPDNVAAAIEQTGAYNVDVSSGVESAPGIKDPELIRRFLRAVKTANQT
jgi:phosphoribosylanthranilate isomerase